MLTPHQDFIDAIQESELRIAEIYDVTLINGDVFHYTTHGQNIIWNVGDDTYFAIPMTRSGINQNLNLEVDDVELRLSKISSDFSTALQNNTLNNVKVVIKRIIWDVPYVVNMEITKFIGTGDITFDRKELVINCKSILDSLNIRVPKDEWQEPCNKTLYDDGCGLTQSDFAYSGVVATGDRISYTDATRGTVFKGIFDAAVDTLAKGETITGGNNGYTAVIVQVVYTTASTGFIWYVELSNSLNFENNELLSSSGDSVTLNGVPVADTSFYQQGEIIMTSGNNDGERRQLIKDVGNATTLQSPMPNNLEAGDTYNVHPGCDKTAETCRDKFDNAKNFRGFLYVPKVEEVIT